MKSITHTREFTLDIPITELFPLFTPEGEKLWVPDWDYENVMGNTPLSEDHVFLTETHDHGSERAIWIVKKFDPDSHIVQYYKIEPDIKVGVIKVECTKLEYSKTKVQVTYKYIALSIKGEEFISGFNSATYDEFIDEWHKLIMLYYQSKG